MNVYEKIVQKKKIIIIKSLTTWIFVLNFGENILTDAIFAMSKSMRWSNRIQAFSTSYDDYAYKKNQINILFDKFQEEDRLWWENHSWISWLLLM